MSDAHTDFCRDFCRAMGFIKRALRIRNAYVHEHGPSRMADHQLCYVCDQVRDLLRYPVFTPSQRKQLIRVCDKIAAATAQTRAQPRV